MLIIAWLIAAPILTFSFVVGFWVQDRTPPTRQLSEMVLNSPLRPGDTLKVRYEVERSKLCYLRLEQLLFDGEQARYPIQDQEWTVTPGPIGVEQFVVKIKVPEDFAKGIGTYRAIRAYACNPLHKLFWPMIVQSADVNFEVVK